MNDKTTSGLAGAELEEVDRHCKEEALRLGLVYLGDGGFKQVGEGELFNEEFWAGAPQAEIYCQHTRVTELHGTMSYQYKNFQGMTYARTLRYKMTTRHGPWYRANMNFWIKDATEWLEESPDSLWQDGNWHSYIRSVAVVAGSQVLRVNIMCQFDGSHNDGNMWGDPENRHNV